jgi:hypothetical protein
MDGSGGGGYIFERSSSPEDIAKKIREQEARSQNIVFETEVTQLLRELLTYSNDRDVDSINTHLNTIKNALELGIDGSIDIRYGGSVSKHTYVDGLSDVDSLVILNKSELANFTPLQVKEYFAERLRERLPNTKIRTGDLAVTVKFASGYEIQLLPCIKQEHGIRIASSTNPNEWSHILKPNKFVEALRYVNIKTSGKMVPLIKLAKNIVSSFPERRKLSGYHLEALAVEIFAKYTGENKPKAMLKHFFSEATKAVLSPIKDKSGQSIHVDNYLKEQNSIERKMVSDSLSSVSRKMQNADGSGDIRVWKEILNY